MKLRIMNKSDIQRYSKHKQELESAVVSIYSVNAAPASVMKNHANNIKGITYVCFDDTALGQPNAICAQDALRIAKFIKRYQEKVDTLIIQCEDGFSRSAGVAAAIKKYFTGNDMDIFIDERYKPNCSCYIAVYEALLSTSGGIV